MNFQEAMAAYQADAPMLAAKGIVTPGVVAYIPDEFRQDYTLAMDAQPLLSTVANSSIPAFLTTLVDPEVYKIVFAPNEGANILGERKKGTWLDETAMFPTVEHTGEVSSYGDFNENGRTGVNQNWPQRQAYRFQTMKEYGDLELERAGLGRINFVSEVDQAASTVMNKFSNLVYHYGVQGLQNYGILNDPNLSAPLSPSTKAAGGVKWVLNGVINATANEVYADIQSLFIQLTKQTQQRVDKKSRMVLVMSPSTSVALTATNTYNVNVEDLLKKNFPNIRFETSIQYGAQSPSNPQGLAGGEMVQLIAEQLDGQQTGYCSFGEKLRAHPIIRAASAFKQKVSGHVWGFIGRMPVGIAQLQGV